MGENKQIYSQAPQYHHICFVSGQNAAEMLGALLPEFRAAQVHAVVTPQMAASAEALQKTCARHGIKCSLHNLEAIDIPGIDGLLDVIWLSRPDAAWAVNITGGTKIMAIAAFTWAARNGIDAYYIDTGSQAVQLYAQNRWQSQPLPDLLKFDTLLNLYGYKIESKVRAPVNAGSRKHFEKLLELAASPQGAKAFYALNEKAAAAFTDPDLSTSYYECAGFHELLAICKSAGKLDYTDSRIIFRDEQARKWCNGIWLEEFVQSVLAGLGGEGKISSWASAVQVSRKGSRNELDAVFTVNNRLYVLECKTAKMAGATAPASSILYKADSISGRIGGIFAKSMLCSVDHLTPAEAKRAENLGIRAVVGANLKNLRKILIEWAKTP